MAKLSVARPSASTAVPTAKPSSRRRWWAALPLLAAVLALAAHWALLNRDHERRLEGAEARVQLRAAQLAHAMALQVEMLVSDLDYMSRTLAGTWVQHGAAGMLEAVRMADDMLPPGALVQATVADREGFLRFGSLAEKGVLEQPIYVGDRAHFTAHVGAQDSQLAISPPLMARTSQQWSVFFSRPLLRDGRFDGTINLALAPEYLSEAFHRILPDACDVALLARNDGTYLARSHAFDGIAGQRAPDTDDFMRKPDAASGVGKATSAVDGVTRLYAFHRLEKYPLTVQVGLDADAALESTRASIRTSHIENAVGSVLLLLLMLLVVRLVAQRERATLALAQSREQLELALAGGELGTWDWDLSSGKVIVSDRWAAMLGYRPSEFEASAEAWQQRAHPDDRPVADAALQAHLAGDAPSYECEYRMQHRDGHWVWVHDRGKVVQRAADGVAQRMVGTRQDVSSRRRAETRASESGERLAKLAAEVPGVVYQFMRTPEGAFSFPYASPGMRRIYGVRSEDVQRSADVVFARIHPEDLARVKESIDVSRERLQTWHCEYRVCDVDGAVRWLAGQANPERLEDGATLWHGYIEDVTEQHHAAEALRQSEERLRLTLEAVRDGLWMWDIASGRMTWDARCFEILGYAPNAFETSFETWMGMLHPSDRRRVTTYLRQLFARNASQLARLELRIRTSAGEWLWVELRGRVVAWQDGKPQRMIGTTSDISERVVERQLRDVLLERSAALILIVSSDRRVVSANARAREVFGRPGEDLVGVELRRLHVDDEHYRGFMPHLASLVAAGQVHFEYPLRDAAGRTLWFDMHGVLRDPDSADSDILWTLFDVTDRHHAEAELKTERLRLTTLLERFPGGVLMEDAADVVVVVNQGFCDLVGLSGGAVGLVGMPHEQLLQRLGQARQRWLQEPRSGAGREHRRSVEVMAPNGRVLEIDWVPVVNDGERLGRVWLVRDISERKQRESELEALATTDALTGLPNRRSFLVRLDRALHEAHQWPVGDGALLMFDIDHFKKVNDTWGHAIGDAVLKHVADIIRQNLRRNDVPGRLGGEEFVALLPDATIDNALQLAERVRRRLEQTPAATEAGPITVTISIGVANFDGSTSQQVLERADAALYAAKSAGRNRVRVSEQPGP